MGSKIQGNAAEHSQVQRKPGKTTLAYFPLNPYSSRRLACCKHSGVQPNSRNRNA